MLGRHLLYQSGPPIPVGEKWTFTSNGSWVAPANGNYKITLVGAGGKGGAGAPERSILVVRKTIGGVGQTQMVIAVVVAAVAQGKPLYRRIT